MCGDIFISTLRGCAHNSNFDAKELIHLRTFQQVTLQYYFNATQQVTLQYCFNTAQQVTLQYCFNAAQQVTLQYCFNATMSLWHYQQCVVCSNLTGCAEVPPAGMVGMLYVYSSQTTYWCGNEAKCFVWAPKADK